MTVRDLRCNSLAEEQGKLAKMSYESEFTKNRSFNLSE
jgi:hypothetical protein